MASDFSPTGQRKERLKAEALHLGRRYGEIEYDREDGMWFHVKNFGLPPGWNKKSVNILIDIPAGNPGYPSVSPQWFWVDRLLRTDDGRAIGHFFAEAGTSHADSQYLANGWGHFCIHVDAWRPSRTATFTNGHSLSNYLDLIDMVFRDRRTLAGR